MSVPSVAVLATSGFSPFHLSVPCIVFGDVLPDHRLFNLTVCAERPGRLQSRTGFVLEARFGPEALERADVIVIPYWPHPEQRPSEELLDALRRARRRGAQIAGLCLGAYVPAYAGLLDHRQASTHWEYERDFSARFPEVRLNTNVLYVDDDGLITSAGTAAGLDCCLYLVRKRHGAAIANKIARRMVVPPHREGGQAQFIERPLPVSTGDARITALLEELRRSPQQRYDLDSLASGVMMSRRSFTRHFQQATGMSAGEWLCAARLQRGQELLETSGHSVDMIAGLAGFQSPVSFRKHFKARFGVSPGVWRRTFQGNPK